MFESCLRNLVKKEIPHVSVREVWDFLFLYSIAAVGSPVYNDFISTHEQWHRNL